MLYVRAVATAGPGGASRSSAHESTVPQALPWMMRLAAVAVLVAAGASGVSARATPSWSILPIANPAVRQGEFVSGSCPTTTMCVAVGDFTDRSGAIAPLIERWNGDSWLMQSARRRVSGTNGSLRAVSCPSARDCVAVGHYFDNTGKQLDYAQRWNGVGWFLMPPPKPKGEIDALSCPSPRECVAVGTRDNPSHRGYLLPLAERWDGASWSIISAPIPKGDIGGGFNAASCTADGACTAVGFASGRSRENPLAERWNGAFWSIEKKKTPRPSSARNGELDGVSCSPEGDCTASGSYADPSNCGEQGCNLIAFVERWNGSAWSVQPLPKPKGTVESQLNSVSCPAVRSCSAVGYRSRYVQPPGSQRDLRPLAEHWNGASWSVQRTQQPRGAADGQLKAVMCPSVAACTSVGKYDFNPDSLNGSRTLAERWRHASWSIQATLNPPGAAESFLRGASCFSARVCIAVGDYYNISGTNVALAERWTGTSWSIQTSTGIPRAGGSTLSAISCPLANACAAVGDWGVGAMAARWDGTHWLAKAITQPPGAAFSTLTGISCPLARACTAVGSYDANQTRALIEHWNGASWARQTVPTPKGAGNRELDDVSCSSPRACTAVGRSLDSSNTSVPWAVRWNGMSWFIQRVPVPKTEFGFSLNAVSCLSATACTAVGTTYGQNVVEHWNGKSWTIQRVPVLKTKFDSNLNAVSCPSASACTAVGNSDGSPLVEHWNGASWSVEAAPTPSGSFGSDLTSVSCPSARACIAVGDSGYLSNYYGSVNLAERRTG